jgi:septum formation protein
MSQIILASASPRRKELLEQMGMEFEVCPAKGEEHITTEVPREAVVELSRQKAEEVAAGMLGWIERGCPFPGKNQPGGANAQPDDLLGIGTTAQPDDMPGIDAAAPPDDMLVIGADTVVVYENKILGKPEDEADAARMLSMLSGNTHEVYTGVTLVFIDKTGRTGEYSFYEKTNVTVYPMTEWEIADYIATGDPMDKAGAYGIQGRFAVHIKQIEGDYYNVVGLPVGRLYQELKWLGFDYAEGHVND